MSGAELAVLLIEKGGWAAVATLGFAVLFNVPKYALPYCALIGALGYALRTALMSGGGMGIVLATLCAALLVGVLATILAQRFGVSGTLFAVGPAIPLVPGSYAYKAVMGMVMAANAPERRGIWVSRSMKGAPAKMNRKQGTKVIQSAMAAPARPKAQPPT